MAGCVFKEIHEIKFKKDSIIKCSVCNKECVKDPNCLNNWLCPDKECSVHKECVKDPNCLNNWLCPDKECSVHKEV